LVKNRLGSLTRQILIRPNYRERSEYKYRDRQLILINISIFFRVFIILNFRIFKEFRQIGLMRWQESDKQRKWDFSMPFSRSFAMVESQAEAYRVAKIERGKKLAEARAADQAATVPLCWLDLFKPS